MPTAQVTLPILPDKTEAWRRFRQELHGSRRGEYERCRRLLGILGAQAVLVETALGTAAVLEVEAADLGRALSLLAEADDAFLRWFRSQLEEIHGLTIT